MGTTETGAFVRAATKRSGASHEPRARRAVQLHAAMKVERTHHSRISPSLVNQCRESTLPASRGFTPTSVKSKST